MEKKKRIALWLFIFLTLPVFALASEFKMKDGSFIKGELRDEIIKMKASLGVGEVNLNPKDIVSIVGGETVEIRLRDGSVIKGVIVGGGLRLKASFGEFVIDPKLLARYEGSPASPEAAPAAKTEGAAAEKVKEGEEVAVGEAVESKTFDLPFNTLWQGVVSAINGMGEKTDKTLKDEGKITTKPREYTDSKTLSAGGFEPGQVKYSLQVFVISLAEGRTKVALDASFEKKKMKVLSEEAQFAEGLKYLRQVFYERLEKVITP
jgi:hypothetical protein